MSALLASLLKRSRAKPIPVSRHELSITAPTDKTLFVLMLEIETTNLLPAVEKMIERFPRIRVVFLHTMIDFRPFMDSHAVFERLPSLDEIARFPDLLDWPVFLADRQALLFAKWRPTRVIRYGIDLDEYSFRAARLCGGSGNVG